MKKKDKPSNVRLDINTGAILGTVAMIAILIAIVAWAVSTMAIPVLAIIWVMSMVTALITVPSAVIFGWLTTAVIIWAVSAVILCGTAIVMEASGL